MPRLLYTVTATFPDRTLLSAYLAWLTEGHVQEVLDAGATHATVAEIVNADPPAVESQYVFESPAAFDRYEAEHAPRLRADGLARFGPGTGIRFARRTAHLHFFSGRS